MAYRIAMIAGSLRRDSYNRRIARAAMALAPPSFACHEIEIGGLSLYNPDLETDSSTPAPWVAFRDRIRSADAVLFATPEYNRSVPGALKNAIDVGSRPAGRSAWNGKPVAIMSATPGLTGAFGANHHLRQCLVTLNAPVMPAPEIYLGKVDTLLGPDGALQDEGVTKLLTQFMQRFEEWVRRFATPG
jgi:chromate reductase